jgi:hypothetical protein
MILKSGELGLVGGDDFAVGCRTGEKVGFDGEGGFGQGDQAREMPIQNS